MNRHHEVQKKEMTLELLRRTIDILLTLTPNKNSPIILNGKEYKSLTLSGEQLINAMAEYASYEEKQSEIIPTCRTTFYKNEYKNIIDNAKKRKLSLQSQTGLNLSTNLKNVEMELQLQVMASEISKLREENLALEMILQKEEISRNKDNYETLVHNPENDFKEKQLNFFIKLIELNMKDGLINIDHLPNGAKVLYYEGMNTNERLCSIKDLKDLKYELIKDNGRIIVKSVTK